VTQPALGPDCRRLPDRVPLADGWQLRTFDGDDADELSAVISANADHLRPWMRWAREPASPPRQREFITDMAAKRDAGSDVVYAVVDPGGRIRGCIGLHTRGGPDVLEIGYWLDEGAQGNGVMTAAAGALTRLAAQVDGVRRVEIKCDEMNVRSAAIPRRLGYTLVAVEERERLAPAETGRHQVWSIDLD
jgi:RimJ/RimL family protein N-acetyltransferase